MKATSVDIKSHCHVDSAQIVAVTREGAWPGSTGLVFRLFFFLVHVELRNGPSCRGRRAGSRRGQGPGPPPARPPRARAELICLRGGENIYSGGAFLAEAQRSMWRTLQEPGPTSLLFIFAQEPPSCLSINKRSAVRSVPRQTLTIYCPGSLMELRTSSWTARSCACVHKHTRRPTSSLKK